MPDMNKQPKMHFWIPETEVHQFEKKLQARPKSKDVSFKDPPYNTGSAFEHYDDNFEHTTWFHMMYPRFELLKQFLREDGFIFSQIDNNGCFTFLTITTKKVKK